MLQGVSVAARVVSFLSGTSLSSSWGPEQAAVEAGAGSVHTFGYRNQLQLLM